MDDFSAAVEEAQMRLAPWLADRPFLRDGVEPSPNIMTPDVVAVVFAATGEVAEVSTGMIPDFGGSGTPRRRWGLSWPDAGDPRSGLFEELSEVILALGHGPE